jgi:hypothetical protein
MVIGPGPCSTWPEKASSQEAGAKRISSFEVDMALSDILPVEQVFSGLSYFLRLGSRRKFSS